MEAPLVFAGIGRWVSLNVAYRPKLDLRGWRPKFRAGSTKTGGLEHKEHGHLPFVARNFLAGVHLAASVIWLN